MGMGDRVTGERAIAFNLPGMSITANSIEVRVTKQPGKNPFKLTTLSLLHPLPVISIHYSIQSRFSRIFYTLFIIIIDGDRGKPYPEKFGLIQP